MLVCVAMATLSSSQYRYIPPLYLASSSVGTFLQVAGDLKDDKPVFLVGRVLLTLVNVMSRAPSLKLGDHAPSSRSGDHNPSSHMCEVVLNVVERVSSSGGLSAIFTTYRHLISLLAGVVNLDPTQDCSRYLKSSVGE